MQQFAELKYGEIAIILLLNEDGAWIREHTHTFEIINIPELCVHISKFDRKSVHTLISTEAERFTASLASLLSVSGEWLRFSDRKIRSVRFV